jgi:hypothetical protein
VLATFLGPLPRPPSPRSPIGSRAQKVVRGRPARQRRREVGAVSPGTHPAGSRSSGRNSDKRPNSSQRGSSCRSLDDTSAPMLSHTLLAAGRRRTLAIFPGRLRPVETLVALVLLGSLVITYILLLS